jgi:hypothetical protein
MASEVGAVRRKGWRQQPNPTLYQRITLRSPASNPAIMNKIGLNIFLDQRINRSRGPGQQQRRRCDGVANGIFPHIYQGLERAEAALTCRQGDFGEDPSEEGNRTKTSVTH